MCSKLSSVMTGVGFEEEDACVKRSGRVVFGMFCGNRSSFHILVPRIGLGKIDWGQFPSCV